MTEFNINNNVKVKLTGHGRAVLKADINSIDYGENEDIKNYAHEKAKPDKDGYNTFQMWKLMSIFGSHMYNSAENVFEKNIIELDV